MVGQHSVQSLNTLWPITTAADDLLTLRLFVSSGGRQHGTDWAVGPGLAVHHLKPGCSPFQNHTALTSRHVSPGQADVHFALWHALSQLTRLHIRTKRPLTSSGGRQQVLYVQEGIST